ncbi:hypothetical protein EIP91_005575 [Steccherinum ochraceum]|uniref:DUF6697 domain-containing protein n=1 Tax=Steccherinum ochraceum TaxID=92696 RepID=A0A4R0RQF0_9APHY|nr:hypothetical protein EIP91_005575 [Steccherinum ochraceum]
MDPFCLALLEKLTAIGAQNLRLEKENAQLVRERDELRNQAEFTTLGNHLDPSMLQANSDTDLSRLNAQIKDLLRELSDRDSRLEALQGQVQQVELDRTSLQRHLENERNAVSFLESTSQSEIGQLQAKLAQCQEELRRTTEEATALRSQSELASRRVYSDQVCQTEVTVECKREAQMDNQPVRTASNASAQSSSLVRALDCLANETRPDVKPTVPGSSLLRIRFIPTPSTSTSMPSMPSPPRRETSAPEQKPMAINPSPSVSPGQLTPTRLDILAKFSRLRPSIREDDMRGFPRTHLGRCLGGGGQSLIANIDKTKDKTPTALAHDVTALLYPKRDLNCWLPRNPGDHGFMFVGLKGPAKDNERFAQPELRTLFIPKKEGEWQYYGEYEVFRDPKNDLSASEWFSLTEEFREGYAACTLSKRMGNSKCDDHRRKNPSIYRAEVEKIIGAYNAGELRVPCVTLRCIRFDPGLVTSLANALPGNASSSRGTKRKREDTGSASAPGYMQTNRSVKLPSGETLTYVAYEPSASVGSASTARKSMRLQSRELSAMHGPGEGDYGD